MRTLSKLSWAAACMTIALPYFASAPGAAAAEPDASQRLAAARTHCAEKLVRRERSGDPAPEPPADQFRTVRYPAEPGELSAYLSVAPPDGVKRPAIVWIVGGFDNGIDDTAWKPAPPHNDQSARAFPQAGIVTMFPSLRGGNDNPGAIEVLCGEVNDVIAAANYLRTQPSVDPARIYLGEHSTGGTLALLAGASTDVFRAIFAFGPVTDVRVYGARNLPFDVEDQESVTVRSPISWLSAIRTPTYVFEGENQPGNLDLLEAMATATRNENLHFLGVPNTDHFSILSIVTPFIVEAIKADPAEARVFDFDAGYTPGKE